MSSSLTTRTSREGTRKASYTVFQARAGDRNDLGIPGAAAIGDVFSSLSGIPPVVIGHPEPALNVDWREELDAALPALCLMQARLEAVYAEGLVSIAATSRCAVSMATLPVVAKYHPDACVVWFDAHADLNTPQSTVSRYLGGLAVSAPLGLWQSGLGADMSLDSLILVGQRDLDAFEHDLINRAGIPHIKPTDDLPTSLGRAIAGRPVYLHLDCDVLEPGIVPTDYRHEGGLSLADLHSCAEVMAEHVVVGIEIAEFQISWDSNGIPVSPKPVLDALMPLLG